MAQSQTLSRPHGYAGPSRLYDRSQHAYHSNTQAHQSYRAAAPRSLASPNWRNPQPAADFTNWLSPGQGNYTLAANHVVSPAASPVANPAPLRIETSEGGLSGYAYCLDRGNGQYTRLIPADVLPPLNEIPPRQPGPAGMVVLPDLPGLPPQGVAETNKQVTFKMPPNTTGLTPDMLQKHIDRIIATNSLPKRVKIYCDKWIHDGVCAFTQQGCKFKHEMPLDKATQESLGLFHGLPAWWRKHEIDLQRQQDVEDFIRARAATRRAHTMDERAHHAYHNAAAFTYQSWRQGNGAMMQQTQQVSHFAPSLEINIDMDNQSVPLRPLSFSGGSPTRNIWGPIEPPQQASRSEPALNSPGRNSWGSRNGSTSSGSPTALNF